MDDVTQMMPMAPTAQEEPQTAETIPPMENQSADSEQLSLFVNSELQKLVQAYPDCGITSFRDLLTKPYAKELMTYWSKGVPLYKAYGIVNAEEIYSRKSASQKQAALNSLRSKSHLVSTGGASRGDKAVPMDVMEQYREFFPDWNDAQIIQDYRKRV